MRDASFPSISLYELRHTQATMLLRRNVHPKIVAERLGHARVASTLDIYSHVTPDMQAQAVAERDDALQQIKTLLHRIRTQTDEARQQPRR